MTTWEDIVHFNLTFFPKYILCVNYLTEETERLLRETQEEKERIIRDKDQQIDELNVSIRIMEKDYIRILDVSC